MSVEPDLAEELVGAFARMSGVLLNETTVATALSTVTSLAADTIANSTGAGVSLLESTGTRITSAATDPLVEQLDDLQYQLDEGPCLTAWRDLTLVHSSGRGDDQRWPTWLPHAQALGIRSFLSAPLIHADSAVGAIKVYSTDADAFDARDEDLLRRFAAQATIFVGNVQAVRAAERLSDQLKESLQSRDLIAMARGILMERLAVGPDDAFRELTAESRRSQLPMRDVAARLVGSWDVRRA